MQKKVFTYIAIGLICLASIVLIALQLKALGWLLLGASILSLLLCLRTVSKDLALIIIALAILGLTPITTDISYKHMFVMGAALFFAVALPYITSRWVYKDNLVGFKFHHGRAWYKLEILYIFATAIVSYFLIPFYLQNTGSYLNWTVDPGVGNITRLFIGTNALGIWDELFFVSTVLGILRRHLAFGWANLAQATMFTSFLFELGFRGWGPLMIFPFALLQGYIFQKTESLLYIITIHLTLDFVLFLALIHAHHPDWMPIFLF